MLSKLSAFTVPLLPILTSINVITNIQPVNAWGTVGHEIIATIAQIHLHPSTLSTLCTILPSYSNCHLAPVATWADNVRNKLRWSATLHYINGINDHPSQHCVFGEDGWQGTKDHNVLSAIRNTTMWLERGYDGSEEALKFLVHFVGDLHQPLHLTGRDKGGNGAKVRFDGRFTNLHSLWDSGLIAKSLRTIPLNYTRPLPSRRIENALRGTIYDPYIRQIMYEGILGRYKDELMDWVSCPESDMRFSIDDGENKDAHKFLKLEQEEELRRIYPISTKADQIAFNFANSPYSDSNSDLEVAFKTPPAAPDDTDTSAVCPFFWASPLHKLNCAIIWPAELDEPEHEYEFDNALELDPELRTPTHYIELDTPAYSGRIKKEWIMERLLAMGGIRLAAVLNYLFAVEEGERGNLNVNYYD